MPATRDWGYFADGTVHLICSSHNDIAWFDTPAATITWRDERSITPALDRMDKKDDVRFSMENVLYLLEYLERHPERREQIHKLAVEKRFDWGATYNQPYESLLSGEQLVRQMYLGRRLAKKLLPGAEPRVYYSPDVPGRAMQMPQILAKSGVPYMLISRHKPSVQYWYSPDGSRVMSWSMGQYSVNHSFGKAFVSDFQDTVDFINGDLKGWVGEYAQRKMPPHFAYLWSADYIPPKDFDQLISKWGDMREAGAAAPSIQYSTPEQFLDAIAAANPALEEIAGERPNIWLYIHGPTHHHAITAKREAGVLLPAAEMFTTIESLLSGSFADYPVHEFELAWANSIYDDHGWGGHNGHITDEVFRQKLERARLQADGLLTRATTAIASRVRPGKGTPVTVFNVLSWQRTDPVRIALPMQAGAFRLVDDKGQTVPYQRVSPTVGIDAEFSFVAADVPSIGYRTYYVVPGEKAAAGAPAGVTVAADQYENSFYRMTLAPGGIKSLFDKTLGKEVLRTERVLGAEVVMLDSVGNGAGEFGSVQQPTTVGDYERTSSYKPEWQITESGPVCTVYTFTQQLKYVLLVQRLVCYHTLQRLDVEIGFYNWTGEKSREYRMMLPVNVKQDARIAYEVPMGVVEVGTSEVKGAVTDAPVYEGFDTLYGQYVRGPAYLDDCADVHPREVQNFISAVGDGVGVTMSSSVAVCDWIDPSPSVVPYPILQPILLASRRSCHSKGNWYLQAGEHHFNFSIFAHAPDWRAGRKPATAVNHPLRAVASATVRPDANLPPSLSFASVSAENVVITAIKKAEDGDEVILRLVEMEGHDTTARLNFAVPIRSATKVSLIEEAEGEATNEDSEPPLAVGHHGIETFKLKLE